MFVDEAIIFCQAGNGGKGCHSFDRSRPGHPRANGGDGGDGGSIIIQAQHNIQTLLDFQLNRHFTAQSGAHGSSNNKTGYRGEDCILGVPPGTEVFDNRTGELLKDLDRIGASVVVCKGGAGGKSNYRDHDATPGEEGEAKDIHLKLKLIADVGIIGFPNAGKSTFISRVSKTKSKITTYPFTTKNPILSMVKFDNGETKMLADIPGIIESAHESKEMDIKFLKHVERTRILLHVIDFTATDGHNPITDYKVLNAELKNYSAELAKKPQILVANKMDVPEAVENLKKFKKKVRKEIFPISAVTGEGVDVLLQRLRQKTDEKE
jgi:GTP-binding protein